MFSIPETKEMVTSVDIPEICNMANPAPTPASDSPMDEDNKLDQQTLDAVVALTKIVNDFIASQQAEEKQEEEDDSSDDSSEMSAKLDAALSKLSIIEEASKGASPVSTDVVTNEDIVARFESITDEKAKVEFAKTHHAALKKIIPVKS
jgi:hypothetical protein